MSNIPKQWNRSLASIQNCCQTFLSSCCDYNYRNTTSKPLLVHRHPPAQKTEFSNPFFKNTSDTREAQFKTILPSKIILTKLNLKPPINNPEPVPLSSLQIENQKNAISKIIYRSELTPPSSPALRSMAPSPEPMDHLKNITNLYSKFGLINEFKELEVLEELAKIERNVIEKFRAKVISPSKTRQL